MVPRSAGLWTQYFKSSVPEIFNENWAQSKFRWLDIWWLWLPSEKKSPTDRKPLWKCCCCCWVWAIRETRCRCCWLLTWFRSPSLAPWQSSNNNFSPTSVAGESVESETFLTRQGRRSRPFFFLLLFLLNGRRKGWRLMKVNIVLGPFFVRQECKGPCRSVGPFEKVVNSEIQDLLFS